MSHTFYINLESRLDKRDFIENQFADSLISVERIEAVTPKKKYHKEILVSPLVAACWLSHEKVFGRILELNLPAGFILEDDALVDPKLMHKWGPIFENFIESEIDCLQIGFLDIGFGRKFQRIIVDFLWGLEVYSLNVLTSTKLTKFFSRKVRVRRAQKTIHESAALGLGILRPEDFLPGTHSYLIKSSFAAKLIEINTPVSFSADQLIISMSKMRTFEIWRTTKNFSKQDKRFLSDIGDNRFLIYHPNV
jgi:GR25 family glycosyltransferase involved in LPS biosynthesis